MCGIVGYIGKQKTDLFEVLKNGLVGLEYRGYDSAGLTYLTGKGFQVFKCVGGPGNLQATAKGLSTIGIGHTRWATHGGISEKNAHPHFDCTREVAVVHNGTIENFAGLKSELKARGHRFSSTTDTEVIAHLVEEAYQRVPLRRAVEKVLPRLTGAYGIAVISKREPGVIVAARRGSPLLLGLGKNSLMVASDKNALVSYCDHVVYLDDNELVTITASGFHVSATDGTRIRKQKHKIEPSEIDAGKGTFRHFMIKEIEEQPSTLQEGIAGRINVADGIPVLGGIKDILPKLKKVDHVIVTGCGTAFHAALYGKYLFEQILNIPVRAEIASELLFEKVNEPPESTLCIFVSQSGETADTKEALAELKRRGFLCLGIVNVAGSSIAREAGVGIYIRAGVERAVASTKAFTSQILALMLLGVTMARQRTMSKVEGQDILKELSALPVHCKRLLTILRSKVKRIARDLKGEHGLYFLGKKYSYPVALEAALKVKEIAYIPTEAYPAGEIKHGPLALVDRNYHAFVFAPEKNLFDKLSNTVHEIKARTGRVTLVTNEGLQKEKLVTFVDDVVFVPQVKFNFVYPFYTVIPFQLLAYELALLLRREIDKPRNLAKSVTVQ